MQGLQGSLQVSGPESLPLLRSSAPLPDGWEEFQDAKYKIPYFYNAATGEKLYERPEEAWNKALLREAQVCLRLSATSV